MYERFRWAALFKNTTLRPTYGLCTTAANNRNSVANSGLLTFAFAYVTHLRLFRVRAQSLHSN